MGAGTAQAANSKSAKPVIERLGVVPALKRSRDMNP